MAKLKILGLSRATMAGGSVLLFALTGATCAGCQTLNNPVEVEVGSVRVQRRGLIPQIAVDVTLVPQANARFMQLEGVLTLHDEPVAWQLHGLEPETLLHRGEAYPIDITLHPDGMGIVKTVLGSVQRGNIEVHFEGEATLRVLGMKTQVPVMVDKEIALPFGLF